jgi:hypothetical protein
MIVMWWVNFCPPLRLVQREAVISKLDDLLLGIVSEGPRDTGM